MSSWEQIEKRLGLQLPPELREFHASPKRCNYLIPLPPDKIGSLEYLYPQVPMRVLPVFRMSSGDFVGLFFPRQGGPPFLVRFQHEESSIVALASDLRRAFADPDRFSPDNPFNKQGAPAVDDDAWRSLKIQPDTASVPELELLKPMSLHYRDLESDSEDLFRRLSRRFGSGDVRAELIRGQFRAAADLHDMQRWIAVSDGLAGLAHQRDAIQALDNCHTILFIHPHYGSGAKKGEPSWTSVAVVLERLLAIARTHGDTFDRVAVAHQLQLAHQFARKARGL